LYGYYPNIAAAPRLPASDNTSVQELINSRNLHTEMIKKHMSAAQNRIKIQADKHRLGREFQEGDQVLLKLQPYDQSSLVNRPYPKLSYKFYGPYKVLARIGKAAYKLDLPPESQVHPVFHVSQLKSFHPDYTPVYSTLPVPVDFSQDQLQPEAILDRRLVKKGNAATPHVKVKWAGLSETASTWEDWYVLTTRFPAILSWGQAGVIRQIHGESEWSPMGRVVNVSPWSGGCRSM
jgi:hypothetical protein